MTTTPDERLGWRLTVLVPVVLGCLSMIGPFSIDTPFPAFAEMERDLPATAGQLQPAGSITEVIRCSAETSV